VAIEWRLGTDTGADDRASIIDLGDTRTGITGDRAEIGVPVPRGPGRRGRLAILAVATALLVAAAGGPVADGLPIVALIPVGTDAQVMVQDGTAVVVDRRNGRSEIAAYDLKSGRPQWHQLIDGDALDAEMFETSSTVVVQIAASSRVGQVEGFALATGARRWIEPETSVVAIPTGLLLFARDSGADRGLALLDPVTGGMRWQTTVPDNCDTFVASDASKIVASGLLEVCPEAGEISAVNLTTGRVRAVTHPDILAAMDSVQGLSVAYLGAVAILAVTGSSHLAAAYRMTDLQQLWSTPIAPADEYLVPCGTVACVIANGGGIDALDPLTGRRVELPASAADTTISGSATSSSADARPGTLVVVPAGQPPAIAAEIGLTEFQTPADQGTGVQLSGQSDGSTWIAYQDGTSIRPVELLRGVGDASCLAISTYVACTTTADQLTVWKLGR
jgi:hypothetical protein